VNTIRVILEVLASVSTVSAASVAIWKERGRRRSRQAVSNELGELLRRLEEIESKIRKPGPVGHEVIDTTELWHLELRLENISDRCRKQLCAPLAKAVKSAKKLRSTEVLSDNDLVEIYEKAFTTNPPGEIPAEAKASAIRAKGIEQYQAAVDLHQAIQETRRAL
jgi:hypothetical protein